MSNRVSTKVIHSEYNGKPMFKIVKVDSEGKEIKEEKGYPVKAIHNFGFFKAKVILDHLEELRLYVEQNTFIKR